MDYQVAFNVTLAMSGALAGWVLRVLWDAQKTLREDISALADKMTREFVRRDDFKEALRELGIDIRRMEDRLGGWLESIDKKLDTKADK